MSICHETATLAILNDSAPANYSQVLELRFPKDYFAKSLSLQGHAHGIMNIQ